MTIVADHIKLIRPSETKAMTARAAALRDQGREVIVLSQGEPDFDTPENIQEAAIRAIKDGKTRYTAVPGIGALRAAIRDKFLRDNGLDYGLEQITVGCGAKQVVFNALFASLNPGDEVIIPSPCWVSYPDMVRLAGGVPVIVDCKEEDGFKLRPEMLEEKISPRSRWLLLNYPCNPTGAVLSEAELLGLAKVLREHPHIWIISDDIYEKLIYSKDRFVTIAQAASDLSNRTLTVNGVSKANAMTGWRVGYGAGPIELVKAMNVIQGQTTSHTCSISQYASIEALAGDQTHVAEFAAEFARRRDLVVQRLNHASGLRCRIPEGAFYVFPSCADLIGASTRSGRVIKTDMDFAMYLLEEAGVAVVPGSGFLASPYIRISYASSVEELTKACDRIVAACRDLR